jgi:riboflavin kinase/FMN adenylyltransferase
LSLEIVKGLENFSAPEAGTVTTIGTFDGVHRGHQAILKELSKAARERKVKPLAITFEPHPRVLVTPDSPPPLLTCLNEKIRLLSEYLDGTVLVLEFNEGLKNLTAEEFTRQYLIEKLNVGKLIVGYDHAFGRDRSGTINDLMFLSRQYSFDLKIVDPVIVEGRPISSTRIRHLISDHKLNQARDLLGHPYPVSGEVMKGIGLGKKLGFPTANINYSRRKLLPTDGVYSCRVDVGNGRYPGMMFVGRNHFNPDADKSVEVNIFDFDNDIYEQELFCYPETYIREEIEFEEPARLVEQLKIDKEKILMLRE